jgi:hypothetical protein
MVRMEQTQYLVLLHPLVVVVVVMVATHEQDIMVAQAAVQQMPRLVELVTLQVHRPRKEITVALVFLLHLTMVLVVAVAQQVLAVTVHQQLAVQVVLVLLQVLAAHQLLMQAVVAVELIKVEQQELAAQAVVVLVQIAAQLQRLEQPILAVAAVAVVIHHQRRVVVATAVLA